MAEANPGQESIGYLNSGGTYPLHREGGLLLLEEIGKLHPS